MRKESNKKWVFVCFDQLSWENSLLKKSNPKDTNLIFIETESKPKKRPYHKQKLVLLLSAMRHFAKEAKEKGYTVHYIHHPLGYKEGLQKLKDQFHIPKIYTLDIQENEVRETLNNLNWIEFHENNLYLSNKNDFEEAFKNSKKFIQETFYRFMRKKLNILIDANGFPVGGKWNFDEENRYAWKINKDPKPAPVPWIPKDNITNQVIDLVKKKFTNCYGSIDNFGWPVTRKDATKWLHHFIKNNLPYFGRFEDAMDPSEPFLFHSMLSPLIHLGLLHPREVLEKALEEYSSRPKEIPLSSIEGFVRQIIGWREYMRHIYQKNIEHYKKTNYFHFTRNLPAFYWGRKSGMNCVDSIIQVVWERGYSHHITRLMVLSNFANLIGVDPHQLNEWFWIAYVDAYEWVVTPNVIGMGTYADGGLCSTKPYIASANYIKKMAPNFCKNCQYNPEHLLEEDACPFNSLYWNFVANNNKPNPRDFSYQTWSRFSREKQKQIQIKAKALIEKFTKD